MRVSTSLGDIFELAAIACVAVFAAWQFGVQYALIPTALGLFYLAQDWSEVHLPTVPRPRFPELRVRLRKDAE